MKNYNYKCAKCGISVGGKRYSDNYPNAHHKYSKKYYKELSLNEFNGVLLCTKCHKEFHTQFGKRHNTSLQYELFKNPKLVVFDFGVQGEEKFVFTE
jgi:5-methylcytosine-specific restriction endonuclease McrA